MTKMRATFLDPRDPASVQSFEERFPGIGAAAKEIAQGFERAARLCPLQGATWILSVVGDDGLLMGAWMPPAQEN